MAMRVERANEVKGAQSLRSLSPPMDEKQRKGMAVMEYLGRPWLLKDGRLMLRSTTYMMKEAQEAADYPDFRERTKEETKRMSALRQNTGHFLLIMLGGFFEKPVESTFRAITARRLAGLALAIRLYQIEHEGRLPAKLADLVPRYLPGVPRDALARDKKIGYVAEADRPRVYSAGNNGTDEGGSDAPLKKGFDSGRWSEEDVVVDLNRQKRKVFD